MTAGGPCFPSTPVFQRQFHLAPEVLGPKSAQSVTATVAQDADLARALATDSPFPARPGGKLELGSIALQAAGGRQVALDAGPATVDFSFSTAFQTGVGVFDRPADAVASLGLSSAPGLDLAAGSGAGSRYVVMLAGYRAGGSISAAHPVGALGSATFAAKASGDLRYAVIHRIAAGDGAATALADTVASWRLPRHVSRLEDLKPGTWLVAQADGSLGATIGARLGYDLHFVRQARLLGMTRELGARIDTGIQASLGFNASGRYLVVVGRESEAPVVRLCLHKQTDHGFSFGLNLGVGVTAQDTETPAASDLVKSVFGLHGQQVLRDLGAIAQWTDPAKDLSETAARLSVETGLDLLTRATGIDARREFEAARQAFLAALGGGIVKNVYDFIGERLDLGAVLEAASKQDFDRLDDWLLKRLSDFFDKDLGYTDLKEMQEAIRTVSGKAAEIRDSAVHALQNRYSASLATAYQRNTADTALLDANFDLRVAESAALLREAVEEGRFDRLLVRATEGVTLNHAALSHEIQRHTDVAVHMPFLDSEVQHVNRSLAALKVEHHAGGVLAYQVDASDTATAKNRYMSQLAVMGSLARGGQSIAYQSLQVKAGMTAAELRARTRPFLEAMLGNLFPDAASLDRFYDALGKAPRDTGIHLQVALPASVLAAWLRPVDVRAARMDMSRALEAGFKRLLPLYYFQAAGRPEANESAAALLVWAALPVSTSIRFEDGRITRFNTDRDVFWDFQDPGLRRAMVFDGHTRARLGDEGGRWQQLAASPLGDRCLHSLLFTESQLVRGAADALQKIQDALAHGAAEPAKAIPHLADFGAALTEVFNRELSVYGTDWLRTLNSMLLVEASRALDAGAAGAPAAMLSLVMLSEPHTFDLADYLKGKFPPANEVAMAQTLTNMA